MGGRYFNYICIVQEQTSLTLLLPISKAAHKGQNKIIAFPPPKRPLLLFRVSLAPMIIFKTIISMDIVINATILEIDRAGRLAYVYTLHCRNKALYGLLTD